jgi:hypothetical protein
VGRFEPDENEVRHLPETLGIATEGLRSTIEVEVARIVERAEARAAEIEEGALEKANRFEQESDRRVGMVFEGSRERLALMFAEMDAVENAMGEAVRTLRAETERLTEELNRARTEPLEVEVPAAPQEAPTLVELEQAEPEQAELQDPAPQQPDPVAEADAGHLVERAADPEVRELIRLQLQGLAESGRTRADAERMLLRFRQGEQYFDLLDDIYPDETPGRRGLLRRRRKVRD